MPLGTLAIFGKSGIIPVRKRQNRRGWRPHTDDVPAVSPGRGGSRRSRTPPRGRRAAAVSPRRGRSRSRGRRAAAPAVSPRRGRSRSRKRSRSRPGLRPHTDSDPAPATPAAPAASSGRRRSQTPPRYGKKIGKLDERISEIERKLSEHTSSGSSAHSGNNTEEVRLLKAELADCRKERDQLRESLKNSSAPSAPSKHTEELKAQLSATKLRLAALEKIYEEHSSSGSLQNLMKCKLEIARLEKELKDCKKGYSPGRRRTAPTDTSDVPALIEEANRLLQRLSNKNADESSLQQLQKRILVISQRLKWCEEEKAQAKQEVGAALVKTDELKTYAARLVAENNGLRGIFEAVQQEVQAAQEKTKQAIEEILKKAPLPSPGPSPSPSAPFLDLPDNPNLENLLALLGRGSLNATNANNMLKQCLEKHVELKTRLAGLRTDLKTEQSERAGVDAANAELIADNATLKANNDTLKNRVAECRKRLSKCKQELAILRAAPAPAPSPEPDPTPLPPAPAPPAPAPKPLPPAPTPPDNGGGIFGNISSFIPGFLGGTPTPPTPDPVDPGGPVTQDPLAVWDDKPWGGLRKSAIDRASTTYNGGPYTDLNDMLNRASDDQIREIVRTPEDWQKVARRAKTDYLDEDGNLIKSKATLSGRFFNKRRRLQSTLRF